MQEFGKGFLTFNDASPTPFHVCKNVSEKLDAAGFTKIFEDQPWKGTVVEGGKYYFTRNGSSLVAFIVGPGYKVGNGFKIIGAHTDSPVLKVKPVSKREKYGVEQVGVETYGGGLWHTWFDRDLGIAGRVIIKLPNGEFWQQLVHIKEPILRIPTLCIHLQTSQERAAFAPNKEDHLLPILSSISDDLSNPSTKDSVDPRHSPKLIRMLAEEVDCKPEEIVDFELTLTDTQPAAIGGAEKEFIFAPRLDNQLHCYIGTETMLATAAENDQSEEGINVLCMFDHEEVGSGSNEGAGSPLVRDTMQRLMRVFYEQEASKARRAKKKFTILFDEIFKIGLQKSILFSSDCTHAIHPNYPHKHEDKHQNKMGHGPVISTNTNQKFSTNGITGFFVRELARNTKIGYFEDDDPSGFKPVPIQEFNGRNDQASGSTIGPHLATGVGLRTVDVGCSHISMHSIREQCAVRDLWSCHHLFKSFYKEALKLDEKLSPAGMI